MFQRDYRFLMILLGDIEHGSPAALFRNMTLGMAESPVVECRTGFSLPNRLEANSAFKSAHQIEGVVGFAQGHGVLVKFLHN